MTVDNNGRADTIRGLREFAKLARLNPNLPVPAEITVEVADGDALNWFAAALEAATGEVRDETTPSERRVSARLYGLDVTAFHAPGVYVDLAPDQLAATTDEIPLPPDPHDPETTDLIPGMTP